MVSIFSSLLFLACVSAASSQSSGVWGTCSSQTQNSNIYTYVDSNSKCCDFKSSNYLMSVCCQDTSTNTCKCHPSIARSPYCLLTSVPATPPSARLCPAPFWTSGRLLNSSPVTSGCIGSGTVAFVTTTGLICNAALTADVIATLSTCRTLIKSALSNSAIPISLLLGSVSMPLVRGDLQDGKTGGNLTLWKLSPSAVIVLKQVLRNCPSTNCPYNPSTMSNAVDFNSCYVETYGASSVGATSYGKLSKVYLQKTNPTTCPGVSQGSGIECFHSTSGGAACLGDYAGPVFCPLNTGETALYGLTSANTCDPFNNLFAVVPLVQTVEIPLP